jgi:dTMP kinase
MIKKKKAFFITVEGLEGSGKSSVIAFLEDFFKQQGIKYKVFREPGSTKIGEQIRQILLDNKNQELSAHTELLLYLAARTQLIEEQLIKAFACYEVVLCDRFFDSTLVYQGAALGLGKIVKQAVTLFSLAVEPDLTILLDSVPADGLARIKNKDRIESRPIEFHNKLRKGYLSLAKEYPKRIKVVDANGALPEIYPRVRKVVETSLKNFQS